MWLEGPECPSLSGGRQECQPPAPASARAPPNPGLPLASGQCPQVPCCRNQIAGCAAIKKRGHGPCAVLLGAVGKAGSAPSLFSGLGSDHSPMHLLSILLSVHLYIHSPANPPTPCPSAQSSIHPSIHFQSSIHPSVIQILTHLPIHPSIHIYLTILLSICLLNTYFVLGPVLGLS